MDVKDLGAATYQGLEFSLDCPWFQPPKGTLRQQFNYGTYSKDNVSLAVLSNNGEKVSESLNSALDAAMKKMLGEGE
jgi:hypothetical protein